MDDYENDGRDYNENIDEGPTDVEVEGFFTRKTETEPKKNEEPEKKSEKKCRSCECKNPKSRRRHAKSGKSEKPDAKNDANSRNSNQGNASGNGSVDQSKSDKKPQILKPSGRRGRRKKEKILSNPFIIFYLEMFNKHPNKKCVAEIATEAGRLWSKMSAKEKEKYFQKAKQARAKRQQEVLTKKKRGKRLKSFKSK